MVARAAGRLDRRSIAPFPLVASPPFLNFFSTSAVPDCCHRPFLLLLSSFSRPLLPVPTMSFLLVQRAEPDDPSSEVPHQANTCELMSSFAIFVQLLLATLAFSTLIFKRSKERPMRPLKVWYVCRKRPTATDCCTHRPFNLLLITFPCISRLYDVSKQIVGGVVIHSLNLLAATIFGLSSEQKDSNPCIW